MSEARQELEKLPPAEVQYRQARALEPQEPRAASYGTAPFEEYNQTPGDDVHIRELWRTIRNRKRLILAIVVIATSAVAVAVYAAKPIYRASTTLEIVNESVAGDLFVKDETEAPYTVNINTKKLILNSRELHEDVIARLKLDQNPAFLEINKEGSFWNRVKATLGGETVHLQTAEVEASVKAGETPQSGPARSPEESARLAPFVGTLQENLSVEQVRDAMALKVSFTHTQPAIAAAVANAAAQTFIERNFSAKTERFTNAASWLDRSTRDLKAQVERAEQALADYTGEHQIFSITDEKLENQTLTTEKLARLHDHALRTQTERMLKQSLYEEVKAGRTAQLPETFADPKINALQKDLADLAGTAAQLRVRYGPENPRIQEIKRQMTAIQGEIEGSRKAFEQKLLTDYERALRDEKSFAAALERAKSEAVQENQAAIQLNVLKQDLDTARALYTDFLQKSNQARVRVAEQHNNVRIIEHAAPPKDPVGPMRPLIILIGFVASLGAALGLAFLLEHLDDSVNNVGDVGRYAQLPALGMIPAIPAASRVLLLPNYPWDTDSDEMISSIDDEGAKYNDTLQNQFASRLPRSSDKGGLEALAAAEAYRAVRTSLLLSPSSAAPKTILVTSSLPGEGKTTTVVNLGVSFAQLGKSVLIIDADLRKLSSPGSPGARPVAGLSTYLSCDVEIDRLIKRSGVANLSLLPCGPTPPNPAELISSDKMKILLETLSGRYDHILIDSPPLISVSDPLILSTLVGGVILVAHGGKSTREALRCAREELSTVGANIFGVVLNNVSRRQQAQGYYNHYGYYSGPRGASAGKRVTEMLS